MSNPVEQQNRIARAKIEASVPPEGAWVIETKSTNNLWEGADQHTYTLARPEEVTALTGVQIEVAENQTIFLSFPDVRRPRRLMVSKNDAVGSAVAYLPILPEKVGPIEVCPGQHLMIEPGEFRWLAGNKRALFVRPTR